MASNVSYISTYVAPSVLTDAELRATAVPVSGEVLDSLLVELKTMNVYVQKLPLYLNSGLNFNESINFEGE